ncbi:tetratricopeptide repeat protein [Bradyrhizobium sp. ARR65]|uniref:tetratricopeptide repeat protein n=1 Tax=Bradyrhizobium sp. ARR65 TaxID=1040989 RepID=UPI000464A397|nr:tetratricopeptide repeat protein [Bradyrhizobium sp. ARR65]
MNAGSRSEQVLVAAIAHHRSGRLVDAERLCRQACDIDPNNARAWHLLGVVSHRLRRDDAPAHLARAVTLAPDFAEAHNDRGVVLAASGRLPEAMPCFERALALNPAYAEARGNLARTLRSLGRLDAAVTHFERLVETVPGSAGPHFELAAILEMMGQVRRAEQHCRQAIMLHPGFFEACVHLARMLQIQDRPLEALGYAEQALALRPDSAGAHNNMGNVLRALGRLQPAIEQYEAALRLDPNFVMAHYNCGLTLRSQARIAEAREHFARAFALRPAALEAELALCMAELPALYESSAEIGKRRSAYADRLEHLAADVKQAGVPARLADEIGSHQPFYLPYQGRNDRELQSIYGALVCKVMAARYGAPPMPKAPAPHEPIRIGIVSGFFRQHSNWKVPIKGWLKMLDRDRFQLFGYHTSSDRDAETELAAGLCSRFVQGPLSLDAWRQTVLDDAPHVLLYPEIGMDKVSAQLAAQRLAPVQCCSWGHPVTSGFPSMDYFISSDLMEPADAADHYSERLVRLPNLSIYYEPADIALLEVDRAQLGLRPDAVVYWCCQSLPKYLPQFDAVFARIAREVSGCQFTFIESGAGEAVTQMFRQRLDKAFAALGLSASDHCVFLPRLAPERFAAAIGQCDAVLDSIGWSGCNSILESLAHDLPIVTFEGDLMRGRHSAAILKMMGIRETIARNVDDYVAIAVSLGQDQSRRAALSSQIAGSKHRLYRDRECIAALEVFLEHAVRGRFDTA